MYGDVSVSDVLHEVESWEQLESERMKIRRKREALEFKMNKRRENMDESSTFRKDFYHDQYEAVLEAQRRARTRNEAILKNLEETIAKFNIMESSHFIRSEVQLELAKRDFEKMMSHIEIQKKHNQTRSEAIKLKEEFSPPNTVEDGKETHPVSDGSKSFSPGAIDETPLDTLRERNENPMITISPDMRPLQSFVPPITKNIVKDPIRDAPQDEMDEREEREDPKSSIECKGVSTTEKNSKQREEDVDKEVETLPDKTSESRIYTPSISKESKKPKHDDIQLEEKEDEDMTNRTTMTRTQSPISPLDTIGTGEPTVVSRDSKRKGWGGFGAVKAMGGLLSKIKRGVEKESSLDTGGSSDSDDLYPNQKENQTISSFVQRMSTRDLIDSFQNLSASIEKELRARMEEKKKTRFSYMLQQKEEGSSTEGFPYESLGAVKADVRTKLIKHFVTSHHSTDTIESRCRALLDIIKFYPQTILTAEFNSDFLSDLPSMFSVEEVIDEYFKGDENTIWKAVVSHLSKVVEIQEAKKSLMCELFAGVLYSPSVGKQDKDVVIQNLKEFLRGCVKLRSTMQRSHSPSIANRATVIGTSSQLTKDNGLISSKDRPGSRNKAFLSKPNPFLTATAIRKIGNDSESDSEAEGAFSRYTSSKNGKEKKEDSDSDF